MKPWDVLGWLLVAIVAYVFIVGAYKEVRKIRRENRAERKLIRRAIHGAKREVN